MRSNESLRIAFRETAQPITEPVTKFGGSPVWIDRPQWPLSRLLGCPMQFIAQIAIDRRIFPNSVARMAYIFMTDDAVDTFDPDAGENAVILQPAATSIAHAPLYTGPTLEPIDMEKGIVIHRPAEFAAELSPVTEPLFVPGEQRDGWSEEDREKHYQTLAGHKIGGSPYFIQYDEFPFEDWRLLLQLDAGSAPFWVNFGDGGCGYVFTNADVTQAKFLWQCH